MIARANLRRACRAGVGGGLLCLICAHFECPDSVCHSMNTAMASHPHSHSVREKLSPRAWIFVAMLLAALSLWTALPLTWLYIGSKVSKTQFPGRGPLRGRGSSA